MRTISTHERGELKTFLFLIQLDYWQAVYAENGGDFAAVMDVMFEHTPDDPLARTCGSHFSSQTRRIQPHLGEWLERGLYQCCGVLRKASCSPVRGAMAATRRCW